MQQIADLDSPGQEPVERMAALLAKNSWSVREAAEWAGVPPGTIYTLLKAKKLPCLAMGSPQEQKIASARSGKRKRRCYRFVVPAKAFRVAWEGFAKAETVRSPAA
jgi:hypothetical protein